MRGGPGDRGRAGGTAAGRVAIIELLRGVAAMLVVYAAFATAWAQGFYRFVEAPVVRRARRIR